MTKGLFHHRIIEMISLTRHRLNRPMLREQVPPRRRLILEPLVRVHQQTTFRLLRSKRTEGKDGKRAGDLLNRDLWAGAPNRIWGTDVTYAPVFRLRLRGLGNRPVFPGHRRVGNVHGERHQVRGAVLRELRCGAETTPTNRLARGPIHHNDAESPYASIRYTDTLEIEGLVPSIGSVGDAYENAAAKTKVGLFKNEAVAKESPFRPGALKTASDVVEVVMGRVYWYNSERMLSSLSHRTPEEYEQASYDENSGS